MRGRSTEQLVSCDITVTTTVMKVYSLDFVSCLDGVDLWRSRGFCFLINAVPCLLSRQLTRPIPNIHAKVLNLNYIQDTCLFNWFRYKIVELLGASYVNEDWPEMS